MVFLGFTINKIMEIGHLSSLWETDSYIKSCIINNELTKSTKCAELVNLASNGISFI